MQEDFKESRGLNRTVVLLVSNYEISARASLVLSISIN